MSDLYKIIKQLQETQGNNAKLAILRENKDNVLLREYMKAVYDPAINYYITKIPPAKAEDVADFDLELIHHIVDNIAGRVFTGDRAKQALKSYNAGMSEEGQELLKLLIKRSIGASVGETMVLKTWPGLFFVPPYMRCSLMDDKIKAKFEKESNFFIQLKADGSFAYLYVDSFTKDNQVITRNGNKYPKALADRLAENLSDGVYVGELEVFVHKTAHDGKYIELLDRKTGNGILNSILQGDESELDNYEVFMSAWDLLAHEEFEDGESSKLYATRWDELTRSVFTAPYVNEIDTRIVSSLEEAYKVYSEYTVAGKEGAVIKTCTHKWKDGTSKECVKLKIEFEAEYVVTGAYEGEGKAAGMLGGIDCQSSDGKIKFSCGSGFTDEQRKKYWDGSLTGRVVTIKANDVVTKRDSDTASLFLPIFVEFRDDKQNVGADSYERVIEQLNACKGISVK